MRPRRALLAAFVGVLALVPLASGALGKPDWAKPLLDLPSPSGDYIAQSDQWACVYGEVSFFVAGTGGISERHRYILENRTGHALSFSSRLIYDGSIEDLGETALNVEKTYLWHSIDLKTSALEGKLSGKKSLLIVGAEDIPAHHRVVWEYVLTGRFTFPPWNRVAIPGEYPVEQMVYQIAPDARDAGLTLDVIIPGGTPIPPSFLRDAGGTWTVREIPAQSHLEDGLALQPEPHSLYPYVLAVAGEDPASTWSGFAGKYRTEWSTRQSHMDRQAISARAAALTVGLKSLYEKAVRLARFVQAEVLYDDSNEEGLDAWFPLTPQDSLRSMKADCKGKAMLLQALLDATGIESEPVLLTGSEKYVVWGTTPATSFINHVVLAVHLPRGEGELPATLLEGPAKGWIYFDPTVEGANLGAPMPGAEGLQALFAGGAGEGRFTIRTRVPSEERMDVTVEARPETTLGMAYSLKASSNGGAAIVYAMAHQYDSERRRTESAKRLAAALQQPVVRRAEVLPAAASGPNVQTTELEFASLHPLDEMANTVLMANPLSAAAILAGVPNGIAPRKAVLQEDRVTLHPPWDARALALGKAMSLNVELKLTLPHNLYWSAPPPQQASRPWVSYSTHWSQDSEGTWRAQVHLAIPMGEWPSAQRNEGLQSLDQIFMEFYQPIVLKKEKQAE